MAKTEGLATDTDENVDPFADMRAAKPWLEMLDESKKAMQDWQDRCDNIDKLYADLMRLANTSMDREMQMFWANMEVIKPAIYARPPAPVVAARFKDRKPMVRHGAELLERSLITAFEIDDIHESMKLARDDLALGGRGVLWVRKKTYQYGPQLCFEHISREDFRHGIARKWREVPWVARRTFNTREELVRRFPNAEETIVKANFETRSHGTPDDQKQGDKKAEVWELWHKDKGVVVWVTPGTDDVLEIREPYHSLDSFFPCPRPAYATLQRGTLVPVPDFLYIRDQLEEINELTARISALAESLRMKGFYSAGNEDVGDAVEQALRATDNNALLIPVPNVASLGGQGMDKAILWMPVRDVAEVIVQLVALRKQLIDDVYQISGISDIMRGETEASETLGAQQLKSQYGSIRIRDKQEELVRVARDVTRIAAEILAEEFEPDQLMAMSQYDELPRQAQIEQKIAQITQAVYAAANNPQMVAQAQQNPEMAQQALQQAQAQIAELQQQPTLEAVIEFLRNERMRPFVLEIETDSTIQPDENAQKERTTEFLAALSQSLGQLAPMISAEPKTAEFAGEVLKFAVSPFRAGRSLDAAIDDLIEQMKERAAQPEENPEQQAAQMEAQAKQTEIQMKQAELQMKMQEMQNKTQAELQQAQADLQKTMAEIEKIFAEIDRIQAQASAPREAA